MEYMNSPSEASFWDSGLQIISACSKAPANITVFITPTVKKKIDLLMAKYQNREWLAYLTGKDLTVDDMVVPKQVATSTSVSNIEFPAEFKDKIIGVIHSHHTMGSFFSGTDHEYINGNHDISIVVSKNDIKGQVRWNTPCGGKMVVPAKVKIFLATTFNEEEFLASADKLILAPEPVNYTHNRNWSWSNRYGDEDLIDNTPSLREAMSDM